MQKNMFVHSAVHTPLNAQKQILSNLKMNVQTIFIDLQALLSSQLVSIFGSLWKQDWGGEHTLGQAWI